MSITAEEFDDYGDEYEEGGLSGFYVLAIFLALLAAFLVVVYFAYERGKATVAMADADLPTVAADPRPVREEVPLALEGSERTEVYDRLEGNAPSTVIADADPARDPLDGYAGRADTATRVAAPSEGDADAPAAVASAAEAVPATRPAAATAPTVAEPAPTPTPEPAPASATSGTHVVQLGAFGSDDEALAMYERLSGRLGGLVADKQADVQRADVNGRTYHRLRVGPFATKGEADQYCASLKSRGQDCLTRGV